MPIRATRPSCSVEPFNGMSLLRLYTRVLKLLGKEARLGWILATSNLLLAGAQFAEPVLFGRIVDVLSGKAPADAQGSSPACAVPRSRCTPTGWRIASARRC